MVLNYKKFGTGFPVIILHGLLGSLDNWQGIAKKLAEKFEVYIIDQRNHGKSPHSDEFNYNLLSNDLLEFFTQQNIAKAYLIGHSMGGKAVMTFALQHPGKVEKLVVVDAAPVSYPDHHSKIFNALFEADVAHATSREQVQDLLRERLKDETTVQFLLKGLARDEAGTHFSWKFNVDSLWKNYKYIAGPLPVSGAYNGKALFVKGELSDYINKNNYPAINVLYPNNELTEVKGAGHWVHADKPAEFIKEVERFLS